MTTRKKSRVYGDTVDINDAPELTQTTPKYVLGQVPDGYERVMTYDPVEGNVLRLRKVAEKKER